MVKKSDSKALLGDRGPVAAALSSYEKRTEQLEMAAAVEGALFGGHNLVVEAGTGVGKSFAYLVPAILAARRKRLRVVISTHTINLQEQLVGKDIPFLEEHLGIPFKAVLAKGRSNYLCIRRLYATYQHQDSLFEQPSSLSELSRIIDWVYQTDDGSRTALEPLPSPEVWAKVCSDKTVCKGKRCKYNDKCFFQRARRALDKADIIIANHSLVFSDLALRLHDGPDGLEAFKGGFMPKYEALIFDEAHTIEAVAADNFGLDVSNFSVRYLLNGLYNPKTKKGFLTTVRDNRLRQRVVDLHKYTDGFYEDVADWLDTRAPSNGRMYRPLELVNSLSEPLLELRKALLEARGVVQTEEDRDELQSFADKCSDLAYAISRFIDQGYEGHVYWVERGGRRGTMLSLRSAPVSVREQMRAVIDSLETVVFTSATLAVSSDGSFEYLRKRLGIDETQTLKLATPFDYYRQVTLVIPTDIPAPNEEGFIEACAGEVVKSVKATGGRAFVLFTSYTTLKAVADLAEDELRAVGIRCYRQGGKLARSSILKRFREGPAACIFGTDSFWQGVDVPGEALSNVIITRLPFPVPDRPLVAARIEKIRDEGGDGFLEYSLPEAVLRFKQGFGRLIRTRTDTGFVEVLDKRIVTRWYGRAFLESIPKCRMRESVTV